MLSEAGPRLLPEYLDTDRKDYRIGPLLDELDIRAEAERDEFQHFLKDFMKYDPKTKTGFTRDELVDLNNSFIRCYAAQFLDETTFKNQEWPVGKSYFPPAHLKDHFNTSKYPKKWSYEEHRAGIIDVVAQIMIAQCNSLKKSDKRARRCDSGTARIQPEERAESDEDYAPKSASSLKRPRKQDSTKSSNTTFTAKPRTATPLRFDPEAPFHSQSPERQTATSKVSGISSEATAKIAQAAPQDHIISNEGNVSSGSLGTENPLPRRDLRSETIKVAHTGRVNSRASSGQDKRALSNGATVGFTHCDDVGTARDLAVRGMGLTNNIERPIVPDEIAVQPVALTDDTMSAQYQRPTSGLPKDLTNTYHHIMTSTDDLPSSISNSQCDTAVQTVLHHHDVSTQTSRFQHDASTQTAACAENLPIQKMAELVNAGTMQAHKYLLHIYGKLSFEAKSASVQAAEVLAAKADVVLEAAFGFKKSLKEPEFEISSDGEFKCKPALF